MVCQDRLSLVTGHLHCNVEPLPGVCGPSRWVVSHGSGLLRQVSLYDFSQNIEVTNLTNVIG